MSLELIIGILFSIFGGYFFGTELWKRLTCKTLTQGIVADIVSHTKWDSDDHRYETHYYPIYEYYDADGVLYSKKSTTGTNTVSRKRTVGSTVDIYYNEHNPHSYYVKGSTDIIFAGIFLAIGLFFLYYVKTNNI